MDTDSEHSLPFDPSDEDDGPNNPQPQATDNQQDDDDDSTDSHDPAPPPQGPSPAQLQQKKQECCDLFAASFKVGDLYGSPKDLMGAIVDAAKPFHFSVRRQGYSFVCS